MIIALAFSKPIKKKSGSIWPLGWPLLRCLSSQLIFHSQSSACDSKAFFTLFPSLFLSPPVYDCGKPKGLSMALTNSPLSLAALGYTGRHEAAQTPLSVYPHLSTASAGHLASLPASSLFCFCCCFLVLTSWIL